jgi:uncharacterized protein (DUF58 family)
MSAARQRVFPLIPRRRFAGVPFGTRRSPRRGSGDEVAGARPYHAGDRMSTIDWRASARLSAARGTDEFVVREYFAVEAVRAVILCDRGPGFALHDPTLPWLDKRAALLATAQLVGASVAAERAELGLVDAAREVPAWLAPARRDEREVARVLASESPAPRPDGVRRGLTVLTEHARLLPTGTFVFVLSDFLAPLPFKALIRARARRWDVVPVVIQDPAWEQSFPEVGGVVMPFVDPADGGAYDVLLTRRESRERAAGNEARLRGLIDGFGRLGFDPVLVSSDDPREIGAAFQAWARRRKLLLRRGVA